MNAKAWHIEAEKLMQADPKTGRHKLAKKFGVTHAEARWFLEHRNDPAKPKPLLTGAELLSFLKTPATISAIEEKFGIDTTRAYAAIAELRDAGFQIERTESSGVGDTLFHIKTVATLATEPVVKPWDGNKVIRFGEVSDTHLGSNYQQITFLKYAYEMFEREGITQVYHAGDIADGYGMRRGHEYEVFAHGADAQVDYVVKNYPYRPGMKTDFITGNHDLSFIVSGGHDIGHSIARQREDLVYHGPEMVQLFLTPNCKLELWHGRDGSAYAASYAIQKYVEAMPGGDKPNILFAGHRHKAIYLPYRNVHSFEGGCIQAQTPFMRGKKLHAAVGFWIVEIEVTPNGTITRLKQEFYPQYQSLKNDY